MEGADLGEIALSTKYDHGAKSQELLSAWGKS